METNCVGEKNDAEIILSVCIATYNRCPLCLELVHELLKYPNGDIEVVVSDNASTDDTWRSLQSIDDPRLKIYQNEKNLGAQYNWINSLFHGSGKYIMNMNDREFIDLHALEELVEDLKKRNADVVVACGRKPFDEFNVDTYVNRVCLSNKLGEPGDYFYSGRLLEFVKKSIDLQEENSREVEGKVLNFAYASDNWFWYLGQRVLKDRPFSEFTNIKPVRKSQGYVFTGFPGGQRAIMADKLSYLPYIDDENKILYARGVASAYARTFFGTTWRSIHNPEICKRYGFSPPKRIWWVKEIFLWILTVKNSIMKDINWSKDYRSFVVKKIWNEYFQFKLRCFLESDFVKKIVYVKHLFQKKKPD